MATTINADTSDGLKLTSDTSGELELQSGGTTKAKITSSGLTDTDNNVITSRSGKNLIINGDMRIDQRYGGDIVTPATGTYTLDRYRAYQNATGKFTVQQSSTAPVGFSNSVEITSTSAHTVAANELFLFMQYIEGYNVADLEYGTSDAQTITISFYVRSSLTGTFGGALLNGAEDRNYPFTYTISSANTWERKTVTIAGDTTGTWLKTNGLGLQVNFSMGMGSSYSGTAGAWASGAKFSATGVTSVVGTSGATWNMTGLQVEKGTTATPFEHIQHGEQLALCQRYCYVIAALGRANQVIGLGFMYDTTRARIWINFPVTMRAYPSVISTDISNSIEFNVNSDSKYVDSFSLPFGTANNTSGAMVQGTFTSGTGTAGETRYVRFKDGDAQIEFNAEF